MQWYETQTRLTANYSFIHAHDQEEQEVRLRLVNRQQPDVEYLDSAHSIDDPHHHVLALVMRYATDDQLERLAERCLDRGEWDWNHLGHIASTLRTPGG